MALAIDFSQGHMIYWADAKLNSIESMDEYGKNRHVIVAGSNGGFMRRPVAVDIFESEMYWANRDDGAIVRQVKVILFSFFIYLLLLLLYIMTMVNEGRFDVVFDTVCLQ